MGTLNKDELIAKDIQLQIYKRIIKSKDLLSERSIAREYSVSRGTSRSALNMLVNLGIISRIAGIGYEINFPKTDRILDEVSQISQKINQHNHEHIVECRSKKQVSIIEIDKQIVEKTRLPLGTKMYKFVVIVDFIGDSSDSSIETYYIPTDIKFDLALYLNSNFRILEILNRGSSKIKKMNVSMNICKATQDQSKIIGVKLNETLLNTQNIFTQEDEKIICYVEQVRKPQKSFCMLPSEVIFKKVGGFIE